MAVQEHLFLELNGLGTTENARNAQRQDPAAAQAYNAPVAAAAVPGAWMRTGDFQTPCYIFEDFSGVMAAYTKAIPFNSLNASTGISSAGGQAAWATTDVGAGINTNFADATQRTRYYALGWQGGRMPLVQGVDETKQPSGRLMEYGWDVANLKTVVLTQQSALQKLTLTVAAATAPTVQGISTWYQTVWLLLNVPNDTGQRRRVVAYYIGLVASTGGTVVDAYDIALLQDRGFYDPSTLRNMPAGRACCRLGNQFVVAGGGESQQGLIWNSTGLKSIGGTTPYVRTGSASNLLKLVRDAGTSIPYDPRVCKVTGAVISGGGSILTITVSQYHYFASGNLVYFDYIGGVSGINGTTRVVTYVTPTSFSVADVPGTFTGAYTSGGECVRSTFQWPDWVVGKQIMVKDNAKYATILKIRNDAGTNDAVELDSNVYANITSNKDFTVAGKQFLFIGHPDPRLLDKAPEGLRVDLAGTLGGAPVEAVIASTDTQGVYVYSKTKGFFVYNIPTALAITGIAGGDQSGAQRPLVDSKPLTFGTAGPQALCYGPEGSIIGYSPELGPWIQYGSSQQLLDPEQRLAPFYRSFRWGQDGETDVTPFISIAYNQNQNFAVFCIPSFAQLLWYDFRTQVVNVCPIFGQRPMCVATVQLYRPMLWDARNVAYAGDPMANIGDVTMVALQTGDILEFNPSFFTDYATPYSADDSAPSNYRGEVTAVGAYVETDGDFGLKYVAGSSPTGGSAAAVIVDTTLADQPDGTVVDVVITGAGRYADVEVASAHNLTVGSLITVTGVSGVSSNINAAWSVESILDPTRFRLDGGAPGYFTGSYTSGGTVAYPTFASRIGSYVAIAESSGGTLLPGGTWTSGAPLVGDIVQVNPIYMRFETREFELGFQTTVDAVEDFMLADESGQGYAVRFRVIPSGQLMEPQEGSAVNTAYPSYLTNLGRAYDLVRSDGGRVVRVRIEWLNPDGGVCKLGSFGIRVSGPMGSRVLDLKKFPPEVQRGDKADFDSTGDLNSIRGVGFTSISPRPGTRNLTVFNDTRPVENGDSSATSLVDSFVLVRRVGGQAWMTVNTKSSRVSEGFLYGTLAMTPIISLGSFAEAVPNSSY